MTSPLILTTCFSGYDVSLPISLSTYASRKPSYLSMIQRYLFTGILPNVKIKVPWIRLRYVKRRSSCFDVAFNQNVGLICGKDVYSLCSIHSCSLPKWNRAIPLGGIPRIIPLDSRKMKLQCCQWVIKEQTDQIWRHLSVFFTPKRLVYFYACMCLRWQWKRRVHIDHFIFPSKQGPLLISPTFCNELCLHQPAPFNREFLSQGSVKIWTFDQF